MRTLASQSSHTPFGADYFSRPALGGEQRAPLVQRWHSPVVGLTYLCIALHVAFPKGGIKYLDIPVTWADALLACLLLVFLYRFNRPLHISRPLNTTILLMFASIALFAFRILVQEGFVLRYVIPAHVKEIVPLCVYPLILPVMVRVIDTDARLNRVVQILIVGVTVVLLYGVLQRVFGESALLVPGLTANATDARDPEFLLLKYNVIDPQLHTLKLTSTYQNGNILGINLLLLFPIAAAAVRRWTLRIPLIGLSLFALEECGSRAVWVGAVTLGLVATLFFVRRLIHKVLVGVCLTAAVVASLFFVPIVRTRIVEADTETLTSLGGRGDPAAILIEESLRDTNVVAFLVGPGDRAVRAIWARGGGASEMLYLALFQTSGVLGVLVWFAPIGFSIRCIFKSRSDPLLKAVLMGLISYLVVAIAEGAFWYPPTAFNLWMLMGIGWLRMEQNRRKVLRPDRQARLDRPLAGERTPGRIL